MWYSKKRKSGESMFSVKIITSDKEITKSYNEPVLASKVLSDAGLYMPKPCGGRGVCGKCRIILNGENVLACKTYIDKDSLIQYNTDNNLVQGITAGVFPEFKNNPLIENGYGAAIDIGTTTVAGYIYKFPECEIEKSICVPNPQAEFGADVISRIESYKSGRGKDLQDAVLSAIAKITDGYKIDKYIISANTTMQYLLVGKNPKSLGIAPYVADELFGKWYENTYIARSQSAYVGADVVSGVLSSGMYEKKRALLIDIGTNGEMVLTKDGKMICCSTAAGPCFEGAGISCGSQAIDGAINSVFLENGEIKYTTIGNKKPTGICGTGLIDAIACLLKVGIIDETGYMEDDYYFNDSEVYISLEDIRKFQLAKSAIRSGIDTLMDYTKITAGDIDNFYIAGGFGSFLNIESAVLVGLIPEELKDKAVSIGNGAGMGASMMLLNKEFIELSEKLADSMETVMLSDSSYFMDKYIENMIFEV